MINKKKPITLRNRTKYFNPDTSRSHVTFSSPDSYQSRQMKIEGYETRLYWQFKYCEDHNGQTFFYTLTYNDNAMPKYLGQNCFDYEDLRDLLTGGFRKQLLRKYGTTFKYFIGAELGDGKGSRGMHNNPHYHVLFFLESANNELFPYVKISSKDFRHLVRLYWQGFDEDQTGYKDYNQAKYGIAKEGENLGLVTDFRACCYCAKYVCKDVALKSYEEKVKKRLRFNNWKKYKDSAEVARGFFKDVINPMFNIGLDPNNTQYYYSESELTARLLPIIFRLKQDLDIPMPDGDDDMFIYYVNEIVEEYKLSKDYWNYVDAFVDEKVQEGLTDYRNRYCNKCRISHGVGDYALQFVDKSNPTTKVPSKKGYKNRPLSMYYYRKLFTKVIIDKTNSPIRVLNDDGIDYKVNRLSSQIKKAADKAKANLLIVLSNEALFDKMRASDINTSVWYKYDEFVKRYNELIKNDDIDNIVRRYAEYKLVYEDRFFKYFDKRSSMVYNIPDIDLIGDYRRFLVPSIYSVSRSDYRLDMFMASYSESYMAYSEHPYFLRYVGLFTVLDLCTDYFFVQGDNKKQEDAERIAETKRFHSRERLKTFYSQFK